MALRIGLIGHGRWGINIEHTLRSFGDVEYVPLDRDIPDGLDGICIATPSATHAEIALRCIEKGIPTFIEKPLTTSAADAERVQGAAAKAQVLVYVGHIHTHNPAFIAVCDLLSQIGKIRSVSFEHLYAVARADSSVFWDCLPHTFSMALRLLAQKPERVQAWSLTQTPSGLTESGTVRALFDNVPVFSEMSWLSPVKRTSLTIIGTEGTIFLDDTAKEKKIALHKGDITYPSYDTTPPLTRELESFLAAIREGERSHPSLEEGVAIVRMIEAAEAAAHTGAVVAIRP